MWETTDPDGRKVELPIDNWLHILEIHTELRVEAEAIVDVVRDPEHAIGGRTAGERWYYRGGAGPSWWIKVVVHYEHGHGRIVTAFPRRAFP